MMSQQDGASFLARLGGTRNASFACDREAAPQGLLEAVVEASAVRGFDFLPAPSVGASAVLQGLLAPEEVPFAKRRTWMVSRATAASTDRAA